MSIEGNVSSGCCRFVVLSGVALVVTAASLHPARAALIDRGAGLIYDTVLDVTWLQNTGGLTTEPCTPVPNAPPVCPPPFGGELLTWEGALDWAANLSYYDSVRGVTWDDWRLPLSMPVDGIALNANYSDNGTTDFSYNITSPVNELAHVYYVSLGNLGHCAPAGTSDRSECVEQLDAVPLNSGPFLHFAGKVFWTGTPYSDSDDFYAWAFRTSTHDSQLLGTFGTGLHLPVIQSNEAYAWAVRDGDVAAIPEPSTLSLLGLGLVALVVSRRSGPRISPAGIGAATKR